MQSYETQDMAFASYLVLSSCTIAEVRRMGRRVVWSFTLETDKLSELEAKWPGSDAAKFFNTYQTLKSQIRNT